MVSGRWRIFAGVMGVGLSMAGCMSGGGATTEVDRARPNLTAEDAGNSATISTLLNRKSVLKSGTAFAKASEAVLAANSRAAEAELRSARLRQVAADKNWLPTLGPQISLTSMGAVIANMFVEQVLYDNGRKKAERAFAKADVEVAAAALAQDTNDRVRTALTLYTTAQQAREKAQVTTTALARMREFERVMRERVEGGVSDSSELSVISSKRAQLEATLSSARAAETTALAELNAMSVRPLDDLRGLPSLNTGSRAPSDALAVVKARAEMERDIAQATIDRAGFLPSLKASGTVGNNGTGIGLKIGAENGLGFGTGASLQAIEAAREGAEARVAQAGENAARIVAALRSKEAALIGQLAHSESVTNRARETYLLFQDQYEVGHRTVMDVVGVFETLTRVEQDKVDLKYDKARVQLDLANELGVLVNGADI